MKVEISLADHVGHVGLFFGGWVCRHQDKASQMLYWSNFTQYVYAVSYYSLLLGASSMVLVLWLPVEYYYYQLSIIIITKYCRITIDDHTVLRYHGVCCVLLMRKAHL